VSRRVPRTIAAIAAAILWLVAGAHGDQRVTQPFVGVTYIDRTEQEPRPLHMHVVQIDLAAPGIRFAVSPPGGSRETVRQTTLEFLRQSHAQLAINAHFFLPFPSEDADAWLVGFAASDGRVYSAFETPEQRYAIVSHAPALNIDANNHATIVHRLATESDGRHVLEPVTLWNAISGSAQIVTDGAITVPVYADDDRGGVLTPGGPGSYSNDHSWYDVTTARTAVGLSRDGRTLTLFTVDVRGGSEGMRVGEVVDLLVREYQVWNALNLDGGGSTSLALEDPVTHESAIVNMSSDNLAGRSVGSSLAVFARTRP
jgi:hypothetical protein